MKVEMSNFNRSYQADVKLEKVKMETSEVKVEKETPKTREATEKENKKVAEILLTCLEKPDLATVTKDVDVKVVKNGKTWEVQTDETLVNAILGDLEKAAEEMSSSFGN